MSFSERFKIFAGPVHFKILHNFMINNASFFQAPLGMYVILKATEF